MIIDIKQLSQLNIEQAKTPNKLYMKKYPLICLFTCLFFNHALAKGRQINLYAAGGNQGLGIMIAYKNYQIKTQYYYKYQEYGSNIYVYYHKPAVSIQKIFETHCLCNNLMYTPYIGLTYRMNINKQKYFFPGTYNWWNYGFSLPLGIQINPFKNNSVSFAIDYAVEFEHDNYLLKRYLWNINLSIINLTLFMKIK